MRTAGQEPNVKMWKNLMSAYQKVGSGSDVLRVFDEMRRKDRKASFGDALQEASKRKKAGEKY
jgi:pentatricopeptide repeat protein